MSDKPVVAADEAAVQSVLQSKRIHTFFQPVVSISMKSIVGFEGFSRGGGAGAETVDPTMLFHPDLPPQMKVEVDRLCREKALGQFRGIYDSHGELLLYLNINPDVLPHVEENTEVLKDQVERLGISSENIVLEIPMSKSSSMQVLQYAELYRSFGFKTGLDNCSINAPFGKLISALKPEFVKIGRTFYADGERKAYSAKALENVLQVADQSGTVVVAQGVECEDDSFRLLMAGVNLQQGFFYTKDEDDRTGDPTKMFFKKITSTYERYKIVRGEVVKRKKELFHAMFKSVTSACNRFSKVGEDKFETSCQALIAKLDDVISMFVLDGDGVQITARSHGALPEGRATVSGLVGSVRGVDHSLNDYVMYLDMGYGKFVTQPFTSPYTGEPACLISKPFFSVQGNRFILCVEMPYPG